MLDDIIKQYVTLQKPSGKGWCAVRCAVCNDHTRKGLRGAFLFTTDEVVYKCWNCSTACKYSRTEHDHMPNKMRKVLDAFGVPESEWKQCILSSPGFILGVSAANKNTKEAKKDIIPSEIPLPDDFYFLKDAPDTDEMAREIKDYLITERNIDPDVYPFMLLKNKHTKRFNKWLGRVIIPIYKDNKLIFYQGRAAYDAVRKYEMPAYPKEKVIFGFDKLFEYTEKPLLIVEGIFDAFAIDGVAILGNTISEYQIEWLNMSKREKIFIPDRMGDGILPARQALEYGWCIATPDIGTKCKDMDDAVKKYGKLFVIKSIMDTKTNDPANARTALSFYCDN